MSGHKYTSSEDGEFWDPNPGAADARPAASARVEHVSAATLIAGLASEAGRGNRAKHDIRRPCPDHNANCHWHLSEWCHNQPDTCALAGNAKRASFLNRGDWKGAPAGYNDQHRTCLAWPPRTGTRWVPGVESVWTPSASICDMHFSFYVSVLSQDELQAALAASPKFASRYAAWRR